jgi:hypothetical protein
VSASPDLHPFRGFVVSGASRTGVVEARHERQRRRPDPAAAPRTARSADAEYQLAIERSGTPVTRHIRRGEWLLNLHPERVAEARADLEAALALDPGATVAREWLREADAIARSKAAAR